MGFHLADNQGKGKLWREKPGNVLQVAEQTEHLPGHWKENGNPE